MNFFLFIFLGLNFIICAGQPPYFNKENKATIMSMRIARAVCNDNVFFSGSKKLQPPSTSWMGIPTVMPGKPCQVVKWNHQRQCDPTSDPSCSTSKFQLAPCVTSSTQSTPTKKENTNRARGRNVGASAGNIASKSDKSGRTIRAVGGKAATPEDVPYIVAVYLVDKQICSGSILNLNYILTSASCYRGANINLQELVVVAGDPRPGFSDRTEKTLFVQRLVLHPNPAEDIALIEVIASVPVTSAVTQVELPEIDEVPSGHVIISGWGALNPPAPPAVSDLRFGDAEIMPRVECLRHNKTKSVTTNQICLYPGKSGEASACDSDKGAPIVQVALDNTFTLVGILTSGDNCGLTGFPSVGVRVSAYIHWIYDNISPILKQITFAKSIPRPPAVAKHKMPFDVRITRDGKTICGGGIVNERAIVTAASCVFNETMASTKLEFIAGDYDVNEITPTEEQLRFPFQFICHPQYDPINHLNDIAMVVITPPFKFDNKIVAPLFTLVPEPILLKGWTLPGWGSMIFNATFFHNLQQQIPMKNISFEECQKIYGKTVTKLEDNIICAVPDGNKGYSTCSSDYGSPLVAESDPGFYTLFGVASLRVGCDDTAYPMIFTDAQPNKRFIDNLFKDSLISDVVSVLELTFHVFVNAPSYLPCGGVILNERFVLTAAQCLQNIPHGEAFRIRVYGGKLSLHETGQSQMRLAVRNSFTHEDFDPVTLEHDIALLELESPIPFNNEVQPGNLAQTKLSQGNIEQVVLHGYGLDDEKHRGRLQKLKVNLISNYNCKREHEAAGSKIVVGQGKLCTASHAIRNCIGDPGAAIYEHEDGTPICRNIVGIVSYQAECLHPVFNTYLPSVHTDVAYYHTWINEKIEKLVFQDGQRFLGRRAGKTSKWQKPGEFFQRSFGSSPADPDEFPHQVQMLSRNEIVCSGAIVDDLHVVTSAVCATKITLSSHMRAGTDRFGNPLQQRQVVDIIKHEEFDIISRVNDVAVITASAPWVFNKNVKPIAYTSSLLILPGTAGVISSWGFGYVNEKYQPTALQRLVFRASPFGKCIDVYGCGFANVAGLYCAEVEENPRAGICEGDQGSPMVVFQDNKPMLAGLATYRSGCMGLNYPSVFTSTSFHFTWISTHLHVEPNITVHPNEFPFLAAVHYRFQPICCCTLLDELHVLIPSRCLLDGNKDETQDWIVLAGKDGLAPGRPRSEQVVKIIFNGGGFDRVSSDDFAIGQMRNAFPLNDHIQPAVIPPPNYANVNELIVNSWQLSPSYQLFQKVFASPVDASFCQKPYENEQNITGSLFCAVFRNPKYETSPFLAGGPMSERLDNGCHMIIATPVATCFTDVNRRPCIFNRMSTFGHWIWETIGSLTATFHPPDEKAAANTVQFLIRIIKGKDPKVNATLCSAVIISPKILVSIASCFEDVNEEDITAVAAEVDYTKVDNGEQMRPITAILTHEDFNPVSHANNIAILLIQSDLPSNRHIKYATLAKPETNLIVPPTMIIAGFEHTRRYGGVATTRITLQTLDKCRLDFPCSRFPISRFSRCGSTTGAFGSGFLGSPLYANDNSKTVYGLHSFRHGCAQGRCTRVFTDLVPYSDWILDKPAGGHKLNRANKYPYHGIIVLPDGRFCSCSLVGEFHVISAMSCIANYITRAKEMHIVAGVIDYDAKASTPGLQRRNVEKINVNTNYTGDKTKINDVVLIEVVSRFRKSPTVGFALLPEAPFVAEGEVDIVGWYFTEVGIAHAREVNMTVLDLPTCEDGFSNENTQVVINDRMICTFFNLPSFCFGDAGSPMTQANSTTGCPTLIGISSQNFDCGNIKFPSIYTNVSSALDYIRSGVTRFRPLAKVC